MKNNDDILADRLTKFNQRQGARVGDFLRLPNLHPKLGQITRFTHDWGDSLQTGGMGGSFYFGHGYLSYSGSLDSGLPVADILPTDETRDGSVWFFDGDISGGGRGVYFAVPMRVFTVRDGAKLDGIGELRCPFSVGVLDKAGHERTCNYWFLVQQNAMACTAFTTEPELIAWLANNGLELTQPLTKPGEHSWQSLKFSTVQSGNRVGEAKVTR